MSRPAAIIFLYLIIFTSLAFLGLYFLPRFFGDLNELSERLPEYTQILGNCLLYAREMGAKYNLPASFVDGAARAVSGFEGYLTELGEKSLKIVFSSTLFLSYIFLAPVISYYILRDINKWRHKAIVKMSQYSIHYMDLIRDLDKVFAGFIRGQSLVAFFVTVMVWIVSILLGLKYGAVLGVISGLGEFIPYFGPALGNAPLLLVAFLKSPVTGLWALGLVAFIQWFDSTIVVPKITGERIGLHPLWVIFALFAGGSIFGPWGIFLAVPLAGIIRVLLEFLETVLVNGETS